MTTDPLDLGADQIAALRLGSLVEPVLRPLMGQRVRLVPCPEDTP